MATTVDMAGNTLIVESLQVGATTPGSTGTALSGTELSYLDTVTAGTTTASKALVVDSSSNIAGINVAGIARIDWDSATATLSSNAATITKYAAVVTSESLTTAAGAAQALVITKTGVAAGDLAMVQAAGGTNTRKHYMYEAVCTTDTVTVTVNNIGPTNALNGTLIFNLIVYKA